MDHGTQLYFAERARNARRLSLIAGLLGLALFAGLMLTLTPRFHRVVDRVLNDPTRFGFEGPEQYVRRITLTQPPGEAQTLRNLGAVLERSARRGGARTPVASGTRAAEPATRSHVLGPGDAPEDLLARAFSRRADVPVMQSEDLIIEKLVRPAYPEHAYEHNIEGRVAVMALVDTNGRVVEVQVEAASDLARFEFGEAASDAVWRCVFRPYRSKGQVREVYAMFHFNFTIN
jgi:TonB family protein